MTFPNQRLFGGDDNGWQPPPGHDLTERIVIGSAFDTSKLMPSADAIAAVVQSKMFYAPAHQIIFAAIERLLAENKPVDPSTVMAELARTGDLAKMGAGPYLHTCLQWSNVAALYHAERVVEDYRRRCLWEAGVRIVQFTGDTTFDPEYGFDKVREWIDDALAGTEDGSAATIEELTYEVLSDLENNAEPVGLTTGVIDLDRALNRIRPGQLMFIAARPAMGKSAVAQSIAAHVAIDLGQRVHLHTLEMSREEWTLRLLAAEARVPISRLLARQLDDSLWTRLTKATERISGKPLIIYDKPSTSLADIRGELRTQFRRDPAKLVIVDYLQLMQPPKRDNREQEVAALSRGLKLLAKEFDVPVICLTQLNRSAEHRAGKVPALSDLRESGAQEQDADVVALLHREDAYDKETTRPGEMDIILAKQRNGPQCTVTVVFEGKYVRISDMAHNWHPQIPRDHREDPNV